MLESQNEVAFVTIQRKSGITAYDNNVPTGNSAFLDDEAKVWPTYSSSSYMISNCFLSICEIKWNTVRKSSIPISFMSTIKFRTFNLRLMLGYNLLGKRNKNKETPPLTTTKTYTFCFLMKLKMFLLWRLKEYCICKCLSPAQSWNKQDDIWFLFFIFC